MRLIFLNVWNGNVKDSLSTYVKEQEKSTDVLCLQEVSSEAASFLNPLLNEFTCIRHEKYLNKDEFFCQATYVRKKYPINDMQILLADKPLVGIGSYVQIVSGNKTINICNTHGLSRPGNKLDTPNRFEQIQGILGFFDKLSGSKIIGGDFNLDPNTESVKLFEEHGYRNLIKECNIPTTRNHFVWDRFPGVKQYFSDYVFINSEVELEDFKVPNIEISDHLPLILDIKV